MNDAHLLLTNVQKKYTDRHVLKGINLSIQKGEFIAVVGKSGCGKSTLLRLLAGLENQCEGNVFIKNKHLETPNKSARMMFQDGRLLPWKSVLDNVCIGLHQSKKEKAKEIINSVGLEDRMYDWPRQLSGGQQQRVALARALIHDPEILLLDEPLGALDALTRIEMQDLIETLWADRKLTTILVTHDVEEAVAVADRVILIENGKVALDRSINLSRPRQRTDQAFFMYVNEILDRIMDRKKADKLNHPVAII